METLPGRDVGALFRRHGDAFRRANSLSALECRALRGIFVCRTGALGGHRDVRANCGTLPGRAAVTGILKSRAAAAR